MKELNKFFDFKQVEPKLYKKWQEKKYFQPDVNSKAEHFSIAMPPPNITGQLHMGHALDLTYADVLVRMKRMKGYKTLWLPGTDHASIATEAKIVEKLKEEGIDKKSLGREKFLERAWEWKEQYAGRIVEQMKYLGASCDWSRERFTMDEGLSQAVNHVFVKLYQKGLIYRGEKLINWCPCCQTTISDAEIEYEEEQSFLWHIAYPVVNEDAVLVVATSRPETLLGDTAVAVHPEDERYASFVGKKVLLPLANREIPILADTYVEKDFGTGVVKITPAHDFNDYEVGLRHQLPLINTFTPDGHLNELAGKYAGLSLRQARKQIVEDLKALGLLVSEKEHRHNVGTCYRCGTVVEPRLSKQWFVKMEALASPAIQAVRQGDIRFVPARFDKIYFNWMENIKDWCISRQLWWGHRIPAYYNDRTGEVFVSETPLAYDPKTKEALRQDEDSLDTWFSSALWPFSTLHWPNTEHADYKNFYPTSVMITGYDIIFFWVARMIFSALEHTEQIPFKDVIIHGIVRDDQGRKMSKSLGNGVDPLEIIAEFGADTLRYSLIDGVSMGNDMRFMKEKIDAAKSLTTKIWNAFKFVSMYLTEDLDFTQVKEENYALEDKYILSKLHSLILQVERNMEVYEMGVALSNIVTFIWDEFCDWYIEMVKPRLYHAELGTGLEARYVLRKVLSAAMQLLHPFMPFITEEVYTSLWGEETSIMTSQWPVYEEKYVNVQAEEDMQQLFAAVKEIRNLRLKLQVPASQKAKLYLLTEKDAVANFFLQAKPYLERLASVSDVQRVSKREEVEKGAASCVFPAGELFIPLSELVDAKKEWERLSKEKEKYEQELLRVENKLKNEEFVQKAPAKVIQVEEEKRKKYTQMLQAVVEQMKRWEAML